jgi:hypothetical protein
VAHSICKRDVDFITPMNAEANSRGLNEKPRLKMPKFFLLISVWFNLKLRKQKNIEIAANPDQLSSFQSRNFTRSMFSQENP